MCVCVCGFSSTLRPLIYLNAFAKLWLANTPQQEDAGAGGGGACELGSLTPWAILNVGNTTQLRYAGLGCFATPPRPT